MNSPTTDEPAAQPSRRYWILGGAIIVIALVLDQLTKYWILSDPAFRALPCLRGEAPCGAVRVTDFFSLTMRWNQGVSYGLLQAEGLARWALVILQLGIAVGFTVWLFRAQRLLTAISLSLVIGGAVGNNLFDRVRFGAVVDFLDFSSLLPWFPYIFNVADTAISVGAALLLLDQVLAGRKSSG